MQCTFTACHDIEYENICKNADHCYITKTLTHLETCRKWEEAASGLSDCMHFDLNFATFQMFWVDAFCKIYECQKFLTLAQIYVYQKSPVPLLLCIFITITTLLTIHYNNCCCKYL